MGEAAGGHRICAKSKQISLRSYNQQMTSQNTHEMTSQNTLANARLLFKALAAREENLDEPISDDRIMNVAVQIGLEGDEFDSALDYAADQGWLEDAEIEDAASWVSLTPAGVAVAKS